MYEDFFLVAAALVFLSSVGTKIKSPCMNIDSKLLFPRMPITPSKFMNNSFKEDSNLNYPRLSYNNTLSVYTFDFPAYVSDSTYVRELPFMSNRSRLDSHQMDSIFMKSVQFVEAADVYINVAQFFFHGDKQFHDKSLCTSYRNFNFPGKFTTVKASFDVVIGFQHPYYNYGHFVFDQFAYLLLLPQNIIKDATFIYRSYFDFLPVFFGMIGVPPNHVISTDVSKIYHAQRYYYFTPPPCHSQNALVNQLLSRLLRENCSISEDGIIKPWRFVFYNREVPLRRIGNELEHIECFQELSNDSIVFQIVGDFLTQKEAALFYYEAEIMFSIHGSIFPAILTMQKGTIYVERHLRDFTSASSSLAYSLGVHIVLLFSTEADRWKPDIEINIGLSEYIMKYALTMAIQ